MKYLFIILISLFSFCAENNPIGSGSGNINRVITLSDTLIPIYNFDYPALFINFQSNTMAKGLYKNFDSTKYDCAIATTDAIHIPDSDTFYNAIILSGKVKFGYTYGDLINPCSLNNDSISSISNISQIPDIGLCHYKSNPVINEIYWIKYELKRDWIETHGKVIKIIISYRKIPYVVGQNDGTN